MFIKFLEFDLPSGSGGMAAAMARAFVVKRFERFRKEHNIEFNYNTNGHTLQVWFNNESDLTFFILNFDINDGWRRYTIVEKELPHERDH